MEGFTCHQCGRSYQLRHNLVKHLRFECGGQKHFTCYLCPARYTQNGKLRQHMLNAHNIFVPPRRTWIKSAHGYVSFRFPCQQCGRGYTRRCNLRRHMKWECGGKRQFPCYYCSYSFTQKTSLHRHLIAIHKIDIVNGVEPNLML
ncbi:gastrula zinc finger protein XlCGF57.1-like [Apis cerana]|uniref:gastrula zinc finger protein XlCGF57.1-like n=1 Tax=Apis cerana TaxID=7461 RepID=UPI002B231196|nr:gastrula zinc finger protein XlCGF57.1-like [Apis cerana]